MAAAVDVIPDFYPGLIRMPGGEQFVPCRAWASIGAAIRETWVFRFGPKALIAYFIGLDRGWGFCTLQAGPLDWDALSQGFIETSELAALSDILGKQLAHMDFLIDSLKEEGLWPDSL
jgi:hypothetical protein